MIQSDVPEFGVVTADKALGIRRSYFPNWLPAEIAELAKKLLAVTPDPLNRALIWRLATDPEMKRV